MEDWAKIFLIFMLIFFVLPLIVFLIFAAMITTTASTINNSEQSKITYTPIAAKPSVTTKKYENCPSSRNCVWTRDGNRCNANKTETCTEQNYMNDCNSYGSLGFGRMQNGDETIFHCKMSELKCAWVPDSSKPSNIRVYADKTAQCLPAVMDHDCKEKLKGTIIEPGVCQLP